MKQAFVLVVCSLLVNCVKPVLGQTDSECITPDLLRGHCISIRNCSSFLNALLTANEEEKLFMKKSLCGWLGRGHPKVCCGPETFFKLTDRSGNVQLEDNLLPNRTLCGFEDEPNKVIGGANAEITDFPWSALLKYVDIYSNKEQYGCGGALISNRYVLTAAHCLREDLKSIRLGETDLSQPVDCTSSNRHFRICNDPIEVEVEYSVPHPKYQEAGYVNDIALVRLKNPVNFTIFVQPICLPKDATERSKPGVELLMAGWGITKETSSESSSIKQIAEMPIISSNLCQKLLTGKRVVTKVLHTNLCAGGVNNKSTCNGDSGGPLAKKIGGNQYYVEAILSFGRPKTCAKDMPAVFTRVFNYLSWIKNSIRP